MFSTTMRPATRQAARRTMAAACLLGAALAGTATRAEEWPSRPIRAVIGQSAGGAPDILTRIIGQRVTERLGQPVVVDLKPAAGGIVGADTVAKAPADGYTWLLTTPTAITVAPFIKRRLPYDAAKDFTPVTLIGQTANVLVVGPHVKAKTVPELLAYARANPGKLSYASAGLGTAAHLAGELLATMTDTKLLHIPYKSAGQALNDVVAGQVDFMITSPTAAKLFMDSGRLTALATTGTKADPLLPRLPLLGQWVPGYQIVQWWGFSVRSGTPPAIVQRIHDVVAEAVNTPDIRDKFTRQGVEPRTTTPVEFAAFLASESKRYQDLIKRAGIEQED